MRDKPSLPFIAIACRVRTASRDRRSHVPSCSFRPTDPKNRTKVSCHSRDLRGQGKCFDWPAAILLPALSHALVGCPRDLVVTLVPQLVVADLTATTLARCAHPGHGGGSYPHDRSTPGPGRAATAAPSRRSGGTRLPAAELRSSHRGRCPAFQQPAEVVRDARAVPSVDRCCGASSPLLQPNTHTHHPPSAPPPSPSSCVTVSQPPLSHTRAAASWDCSAAPSRRRPQGPAAGHANAELALRR